MKVFTTKIGAAQSQLRLAIRLWFDEGDLASMLVLACSAHQIVSDINVARGGRDLLYDSLVIKDEGRKEWIQRVKAPYNFLKHANHDPDPEARIALDIESAEFFILFTCLGIELLGYSHDSIERAFLIYFMIHHPELLQKDCNFLSHFPKSSLELAMAVSKQAFFEAFMRQ